MKLFNQHSLPQIEVELKIIGFFLDEYVNVVTRITIRSDSSLADIVRAAYDMGIVSMRLSSYLNTNLRELSVLLNGEAFSSGGFRRTCLQNSDSVLIFSPLSGG